MLSERTEILKSFDGTDILFRVFSPRKRDRRPNVSGLLLAVHDFGEHSGRYAELAQVLCENNLALASFDLRGHGKSGPRRGDAENFQALVADIIFMMNHSRSYLKIENSNSKFFGVLGLGFGALLATYASSVLGASCPPLLLASPLFATKQKLPTWKKMLALSLPRVAPFAQLPRNFLSNSSSQLETQDHSEDPLHLQTITPRMEEIFLQATNDFRIRNALSQLESSTSILCGTNDSIVDTDRVRDLFPSLGTSQSSLLFFENSAHDLFAKNSPSREQIIETILRWTKSHGAPL